MVSTFNEKMNIDILYKNSINLINNIDLTNLNEGDIFYIFKDKSNKEFQIKNDEKYKYINNL